ncbi:barstar family protein [Aerophototrophica crusticola]|uniref:Barstar family protein n=1 Tax=Aerophototrophica crusticola TaxID=1709002 RepID=A0A858RAP9_9PROT|nr:barstar family protein [Rhodospirillaceae bacterium B3]
MFAYYKDSFDLSGKDIYQMKIPACINSKEELLLVLKKAGKFPNYFGMNWDALNDCLSDLQWIKQRNVLIVHENLPALRKDEESIYIDILWSCSKRWEMINHGKISNIDKTALTHIHELHCVFPMHLKRKVEHIIKTAGIKENKQNKDISF